MIKGFKKFCLCLLAAGAAGGILAGCNSPANRVLSSRQEYAEQMQAAVSTPFGAYPETVVYTLGKMISTNIPICRRGIRMKTMRIRGILRK